MYMEERADLYIDKEAQYIRIQLAGTNYLSLAEVEVWGYPPIENWEHTEGMKRWTQMWPEGRYPFGRQQATLTMYSNVSAVLFGGFVKEDPYFLSDFWTVMLPTPDKLSEKLVWTPLEPKMQMPQKQMPTARYGHTAAFSKVCSLGYTIEEGVLAGDIVLETLLETVPPHVYPGVSGVSEWCRGQIIYFGGSTAAFRDPKHISYPEGFLGDMWLYNVSSNTLSEVPYNRQRAVPVRRRDHAIVINKVMIRRCSIFTDLEY